MQSVPRVGAQAGTDSNHTDTHNLLWLDSRETHLVAVEDQVAGLLHESPDGAIRLAFGHDEDGTVTCTAQANMKGVPEHETDFLLWQPPRTMLSIPGSDHEKASSGSSSTTAQDGRQSVDVELSIEDLASLPRREGGDLELTFCIQGKVRRPPRGCHTSRILMPSFPSLSLSSASQVEGECASTTTSKRSDRPSAH